MHSPIRLSSSAVVLHEEPPPSPEEESVLLVVMEMAVPLETVLDSVAVMEKASDIRERKMKIWANKRTADKLTTSRIHSAMRL